MLQNSSIATTAASFIFGASANGQASITPGDSRMDVLLAQRRVSLLGRTIDLSLVIGLNLNKARFCHPRPPSSSDPIT